MLTPEVVLFDFEGFRHKKSGFIINELSIYSTNYWVTILFLPRVSYNSLSSRERKSHPSVSKFLHDLSWNSGTYSFWFPSQIFIAIKLRFPSGRFYATRKLKKESLQTLLQEEVIHLDTLLCQKVEEIVTPIKHFICALHSLYFIEKQKKRHGAKKKEQLCFYWVTLPANEPSSGEGSLFSSSSEFISKFDSMQLHNEW